MCVALLSCHDRPLTERTAQTPNPSGSSISPESRRRILAALNGFRPKFRQIAQTLTDVDLVFVEEAMERWMLEYDRAFACTPFPWLFPFSLHRYSV